MFIRLTRDHWVFMWRLGSFNESIEPIGIMIKPVSNKVFSERYEGYAHEMTIGPLYFRTYKRKRR